MTAARARRGSDRIQGNIEPRGDSLRVRVYAGPDPVTGRPVYLRKTMRGTDDAARRTARRTLNRLVAETEKARRPSSVISLGHVIDEWLSVAEHEDSTRETYLGYIERTIRPAVGAMSIAKLQACTAVGVVVGNRLLIVLTGFRCPGTPGSWHGGAGLWVYYCRYRG